MHQCKVIEFSFLKEYFYYTDLFLFLWSRSFKFLGVIGINYTNSFVIVHFLEKYWHRVKFGSCIASQMKHDGCKQWWLDLRQELLFCIVFNSRSNIEENHSKLLSKLAKQAAGGCVQGTFAPVWQVLRTSAEKLSKLHMQMVQKVSELVKEVSKYADELHKKHKTVCWFSFIIVDTSVSFHVGKHC